MKTANELISETSLHGIVKIFGTNKILISRLIWAIMSLASYIYCARFIIKNIDEYYQYPVITNTNRVYQNEAEFPMIKFCYAAKFSCRFEEKDCKTIPKGNNCQVFNRVRNATYYEHPVVKSIHPGKSNGLKLDFQFENRDIVLKIMNESIVGNSNNYITISPHLETSLVITRVYERKLAYPYSNCKEGYSFDLGPDDHFNRSMYPYFRFECLFLCQIQKFYEAINKTEEYFQNFQYFFTNYIKWYQSIYLKFDSVYKPLYPDIYRNVTDQYETVGKYKFCEHVCPIECNHMYYTVTPYDQRRNSPDAVVFIYYEDFTYTEITEIPKISGDNLFANIGGILGLFLGASVLSIAEIPEFIIIILYELIYRSCH